MIRSFSHIYKLVLIAISAVLIISLYPTPSYAQATDCDEEFYSLNDIAFYNPCEVGIVCTVASGSLTGPAPSALVGESNEEKVWNYLISRGLTPVAAAGAMGNMQQESSTFDPWAGEHGSTGSLDKHRLLTGFGIIQWTNTGGNTEGRRYGVMKYMEDNGVTLNASDPSQLDNALLLQLNYLWDGEYKALTWQEQVNAEERIEGDPSKSYGEDNTGNGTAMVFHKFVERSGDGTAGKQERIDSAKAFYEQFAGTEAAAASGCSNSTVSANGLDWDRAVKLGNKIVDDWSSNFCGSGSIKNGFYCSWTSGYCTAGAAFLAVTTAEDPTSVIGIPNGKDVAAKLVSHQSDVYTTVNSDGSNLQPFSIWSFRDTSNSSGQPGHTGTIVGVNDDGSIITLETNWTHKTPKAVKSHLHNPGHKVAVFQYANFEDFKTSRTSAGYAYEATATPKDSSIATEMGKKIAAYLGN